MINIRRCTSVADLSEFLERQPKDYTKYFGSTDPMSLLGMDYLYFIYKNDEMMIVGIIGCKYRQDYFIKEFCKKYWLMTLVDHKYQGQGIATEATKLLLYKELPKSIKEIYSGINNGNHGNIRVKEKLGFRVAGRKSNTIVYKLNLQESTSSLP